MKKSIPVLALGIALALSSCNFNRETRTETHSENHSETLSTTGTIVLDEAKTKIVHMEPESFLSYEVDGDKIAVSTMNNTAMTYEVDGEEVKQLTKEHDIKLFNQAIKALAKQQESKAAEAKN